MNGQPLQSQRCVCSVGKCILGSLGRGEDGNGVPYSSVGVSQNYLATLVRLGLLMPASKSCHCTFLMGSLTVAKNT